MKKLLSTIVLMLLPLLASADAVEIDGIYYNLVNKAKSAEVTSNPNKYSGSVVIPEKVEYEGTEYSVTSIVGAFYECSGLTSITIPNSVTSIGGSAFYACSGLTSITIPNSVTSIGGGAFSDCTSLTSITIPNSVLSIGGGAFQGCTGLTSITIPNSVTSIGGCAFRWCTGLTSVTIGNSVTNIETDAFSGCTGLTSVIISNGVTSIGGGAFSDCTSLTSITIPNSVTSIGGSAFYCSGLTSITIPNSVTSIGGGAFSGCSGLTSIKVESGNTKYDSRDNCNAIIETTSNTLIAGCKNTTIPNSVTSIGSEAFSCCTGLTSITIPNSVTSIDRFAFSRCSGLTSVSIGNGIKSINYQAFASCPELTDVYCFAEAVPSTDAYAFYDSYTEYATLHVPTGSIENYKSTEPWSAFKTIVSLDGTMPEDPETPKCEKPTISYQNGQLKFNCATEGVSFVTDITDTDIKTHYDATISLTATYNVSVYATKSGYDISDVATATLCWIDVDPKTEGISNGVASVRAKAVMIQNNGSVLNITGAPEGSIINVYDLSGQMVGSATAGPESTNIPTTLQSGEIGVVKIGDKAVKVVVR